MQQPASQLFTKEPSESNMAYQGGVQLRRQELGFDGFLVDLDGTIIDSTAAVVNHWRESASSPGRRIPPMIRSLADKYGSVGEEIGVDPDAILEMSHGRRSLDVLKLVAPEKATWECKQSPAGRWLFQAESGHCLIRLGLMLMFLPLDVQKIESAIPKNHGSLATEIPGASSFLNSLASFSAPWAIVTSSTAPLAKGWLTRFNLPSPKPGRLITAESVKVGKPDPACYFLGRHSIQAGDSASELLVIEDSPAGIRAGKEANCKVLGLLTSHEYDQVAAAGPDWVVKDLESVKILAKNRQTVMVEICDIL
ncbi:hypothetical protein ACJZ2D_009660 [Fusarium nematophilum]